LSSQRRIFRLNITPKTKTVKVTDQVSKDNKKNPMADSTVGFVMRPPSLVY
jgi:hypothetical protein